MSIKNSRVLILSVIALIFSGCAATSSSYLYRPQGMNGPEWAITGKVNFINGEVTILINNTPIIQDSLNIITFVGNFQGIYMGKPIIADCDYYWNVLSPSYEECIILIDGEPSATLIIKQPGT